VTPVIARARLALLTLPAIGAVADERLAGSVHASAVLSALSRANDGAVAAREAGGALALAGLAIALPTTALNTVDGTFGAYGLIASEASVTFLAYTLPVRATRTVTSAVAEARAVCNAASITSEAVMTEARTVLAHTVGGARRRAGAGQGAAVAVESSVVALTVELTLRVLLALPPAVAIFGTSRSRVAILASEAVIANALASVDIALAIALGAVVRADMILAALTRVARHAHAAAILADTIGSVAVAWAIELAGGTGVVAAAVARTGHASAAARALSVAQALNLRAIRTLPLPLTEAVSLHVLHSTFATAIAVVLTVCGLAQISLEAEVAGAGAFR